MNYVYTAYRPCIPTVLSDDVKKDDFVLYVDVLDCSPSNDDRGVRWSTKDFHLLFGPLEEPYYYLRNALHFWMLSDEFPEQPSARHRR